jgi:hypothetical protein
MNTNEPKSGCLPLFQGFCGGAFILGLILASPWASTEIRSAFSKPAEAAPAHITGLRFAPSYTEETMTVVPNVDATSPSASGEWHMPEPDSQVRLVMTDGNGKVVSERNPKTNEWEDVKPKPFRYLDLPTIDPESGRHVVIQVGLLKGGGVVWRGEQEKPAQE